VAEENVTAVGQGTRKRGWGGEDERGRTSSGQGREGREEMH